MLVLTRKIGEKVVIDDNIIIEVVEVRGNRVKIGVSAPDYLSIIREELLPLIKDADKPGHKPLGACA